MKKTIIGSLVGAIILFICQFLSWGMLNLHQPAQQYTPRQEEIMNFLKSQQLAEGGYFMPTLPQGTSTDEWKKHMEDSKGKPWATIQYHDSMKTDMAINMIMGLLVNIITVFLLCWILRRFNTPSFNTILIACLFTGLIVFLNVPYTNYIWYEGFDTWAHFIDAFVGWGLCGLWLAWWLRRK